MHRLPHQIKTRLLATVISVTATMLLVPIASLAAALPAQAAATPGLSAVQDADVLAVLAKLSGRPINEIRALRNQLGGWQKVIAALHLDENTVRMALSQAKAQTSADAGKQCTCTSIGQLPLTELGTGLYQGQQGGLYPGGTNTIPDAHLAAGLAIANQVQPLNRAGQPDPNGKIVLLTIGMSHTTQETQAFIRTISHDSAINPQLVVVDGAQGGQDTTKVLDVGNTGSGKQYWETVKKRLATAGVTPAQVQVAWLKEAVAGPTLPFPADAESLQAQLRAIVQKAKEEFPNLNLMYVSSRGYAGYAGTKLNPEPFAYQSGFAVKWLIAEQIQGNPALNYDITRGKVMAPWLAWGPYLWTDGLTPRADGLIWECSDTVADGTHPSASGQAKVAKLLQDFFKTDATTKSWFLAGQPN